MKRVNGRVIYITTAVAVLALIGGFAIASISLVNSTQDAAGNYVSSGGAVTGVTYSSTVLSTTANPAPSASSGTGAAPQAVVSGDNDFCVSSSCTSGDFAQLVTYAFTASFAGSIQITITVTASAGGGTTTVFLKQASTAVAGNIILDWDMGSSSATLTAVTLALQQCSGATCP